MGGLIQTFPGYGFTGSQTTRKQAAVTDPDSVSATTLETSLEKIIDVLEANAVLAAT